MYKDKKRCLKCEYGYFPKGMESFLGVPMCLFYCETGRHRDGNDDYCNSFKEISEEFKERGKEKLRRQENEFINCYW